MVNKNLKDLAKEHSDNSVEFSCEEEPEYMAIIRVGGYRSRKKMSVVIPKERLMKKESGYPFEIAKCAMAEDRTILQGEKHEKELSEILDGNFSFSLPGPKYGVWYKSIFDYFEERLVNGKHYFVAEIGVDKA